MHKKIGLYLLSVSLVFALAGCSRSQKAIQIKGSDTMVNLAQAWAEEFMNRKPNLAVAVTGGGSGTGIAALLNGTTDIAQSSREMERKELEAAWRRGIKPHKIHVANDGITIVVNPANPVSKITEAQLSDIFSGKIKNWKAVGGADKEMVVLSRDRNSGTHVYFLERIVKLGDKKSKNEFAPAVLMMPSSQAIIAEVSNNPAAIGYVGLGYLTSKEKALAVAKDAQSPYVVSSIKSIISGKYPISRSLLFYINGKPTQDTKALMDFVLSTAGQKIVLKMDFVPLK